MDYAKAQISENGYQISNYFDSGQTFLVYSEQNGVYQTQLNLGLSYLTYVVKNNIPVIVGVDDEICSSNPQTDNTTDHFIVIIGMGQDSNGKKDFTFYDNSSGNKELGASILNKLYLNNCGLISGNSQTRYAINKPHEYRLTQIRKSKRI
jgi:hypothetical protein